MDLRTFDFTYGGIVSAPPNRDIPEEVIEEGATGEELEKKIAKYETIVDPSDFGRNFEMLRDKSGERRAIIAKEDYKLFPGSNFDSLDVLMKEAKLWSAAFKAEVKLSRNRKKDGITTRDITCTVDLPPSAQQRKEANAKKKAQKKGRGQVEPVEPCGCECQSGKKEETEEEKKRRLANRCDFKLKVKEDQYGKCVITKCNLNHKLLKHDEKVNPKLGKYAVPLLMRFFKKDAMTKELPEIRDDLLRKCNLNIPYTTLYCAQEAIKNVCGVETGMSSECIKLIPSFCEKVKGLGGFAMWQPKCIQDKMVKLARVFVAFPSIAKLLGTHVPPAIVCDGSFMTSEDGVKMTLLAAIARTGENHIFPMAIALVDNETLENWKFFFSGLKKSLEDVNFQFWDDLVITSDGDKGLAGAISQVFRGTNVKHTLCVRHLSSAGARQLLRSHPELKNQRATLKECCSAFHSVCYSANTGIQESVLRSHQDIRWLVEEMLEYTRRLIPQEEKWMKSSMLFNNFDNMTSNNAESFNAATANHERKMTFLECLVTIWNVRLLGMFIKWKSQLDVTYHPYEIHYLTPYMENLLIKAGETFHCVVEQEHENGTFNVSHGNKNVLVAMNGSCTCGWRYDRFLRPCIHTAAVALHFLTHDDRRVLDIIQPYYHISTYRDMLDLVIPPPPNIEELLPFENLLPPDPFSTKGRKAEVRRRIPEVETIMTGRYYHPNHARINRIQEEQHEIEERAFHAEYAQIYEERRNIRVFYEESVVILDRIFEDINNEAHNENAAGAIENNPFAIILNPPEGTRHQTSGARDISDHFPHHGNSRGNSGNDIRKQQPQQENHPNQPPFNDLDAILEDTDEDDVLKDVLNPLDDKQHSNKGTRHHSNGTHDISNNFQPLGNTVDVACEYQQQEAPSNYARTNDLDAILEDTNDDVLKDILNAVDEEEQPTNNTYGISHDFLHYSNSGMHNEDLQHQGESRSNHEADMNRDETLEQSDDNESDELFNFFIPMESVSENPNSNLPDSSTAEGYFDIIARCAHEMQNQTTSSKKRRTNGRRNSSAKKHKKN